MRSGSIGAMRVLVLGGSVFLSRAVAAEAVRRGHEVVCACRGRSGSVPDGARLVAADRAGPLPAELTGRPGFDAVVDVARQPSMVRTAVRGVRADHWTFVSTVNVYADDATPGGRPETLPLREAQPEDVELDSDPAAYGRMKVACEELVLEYAAVALVIRPGLIVGPGDPSGRFGYWPRRLAEGGTVLAPGDPADRMQLIDVGDLADWILDSAEQRRTGVLDGVGPGATMASVLEAVRRGCAPTGEPTTFTWVDQHFLNDQQVPPWSGDGSLPLWLPRPDHDGMIDHDDQPARAAGLRARPLEQTARETLDWLRATPDAPVTGMSRAREAELLAGWSRR